MLAATVKTFELLHKMYTNDTLLNCLNAHLPGRATKCREASDTQAVALEEGGRGGVRGNLNIALHTLGIGFGHLEYTHSRLSGLLGTKYIAVVTVARQHSGRATFWFPAQIHKNDPETLDLHHILA